MFSLTTVVSCGHDVNIPLKINFEITPQQPFDTVKTNA